MLRVILAGLFSFVLACGAFILPLKAPQAVYAGAATEDPDGYVKLSDPDTSNAAGFFDGTTLENGRLWTDKSVNAEETIIYDFSGKPVESIAAEAGQFLITLSALSEAYSVDTFIEPIDAVFIVDLSGSMTYGFNDSKEDAGSGQMRVDAMTEALNAAVEILMEANPENRVAVVGYGGLPNRIPRTYSLLGDLDHYTAPAGQDFFNVQFVSVGNANFYVTPGVTGASGGYTVPDDPPKAPVSGGTPTQQGIYKGAQILVNNPDTTYTDPVSGRTVKRKPVMILMTDGEPTFGWSDYAYPFYTPVPPQTNLYEAGNAVTPDQGIDILTVLTASYWKEQVRGHYYGPASPDAAGFYTIGVYIDNMHTRSVLDPKTYAAQNVQPYAGDDTNAAGDYNMGAILDAFITSPAESVIGFPIIQMIPVGANPLTPPRHWVDIRNSSVNFVNNYYYADIYIQADDAEQLKSAFESVASSMVAQGNYITEIESGDPDFSGYLIFSDVLGEYMELKSFKGVWFDNQKYDGQHFARDITDNGSASPIWTHLTDSLALQMEVTDETAEEVVESSIAGGSIYYNSPADFGNQIKWYADGTKNYVGPFYDHAGTEAAVPSGAKCIMDLYAVEGQVKSSVTGQATDMMTVCFVVLTALESGVFTDTDDDELKNIARELIKGQQIVRWYIPASMIPMRTIIASQDSTEDNVIAEIKETDPIRVVYSAGLQEGLTMEGLSSSYKNKFRRTPPRSYGYEALYVFFSNQFDNSINTTMAFCEMSITNSFYYYTAASGKVPLYVSDGDGGYIPAENEGAGPFYTKDDYFDINAEGYIVERYEEVYSPWIINDGGTGAPYIDAGTLRSEYRNGIPAKTKNVTETNPYVDQIYNVITAPGAEPVQIRQFGNNGLLGIPDTEIRPEPPVQPPVQPPGQPPGKGAPPPAPAPPHFSKSYYTGDEKPLLFLYVILAAASIGFVITLKIMRKGYRD